MPWLSCAVSAFLLLAPIKCQIWELSRYQLTHHKLTTSGLSEKHKTWQFVPHQEHWSPACASGCQYISAQPARRTSRCDTELSSSTAVMTLSDGVTSTNGGCTAAPSFSYSAQTLIVPYFLREIYIYFYIWASFPAQRYSKASDGF